MQKNFVFLCVILVVLVVVSSANSCKLCGNPWCSAEDTHDRIELSIVEQSGKRHPWLHHDDSSGWGVSKCKHSKCESDCSYSGGGWRGHSKDCRDCCKECGGHRCHGRDGKSCSSSCPGDKGVKKLECKCKPRKSHAW